MLVGNNYALNRSRGDVSLSTLGRPGARLGPGDLLVGGGLRRVFALSHGMLEPILEGLIEDRTEVRGVGRALEAFRCHP